MTTKEKIVQLVSQFDEQQSVIVLKYIYNMLNGEIEEVEPDEWDKQAIKNYEENPLPEFIDIEEVAQKFGIQL